MREKRVRGGGSSAVPGRLGPGLIALCLWLGLATSQQVAGAPVHQEIKNIGDGSDRAIKNFQLTLTLTGTTVNPRSSGTLSLISQDGDPGKALPGTYTVSGGGLEAKFHVERGWKRQYYPYISGGPFGDRQELEPRVEVFAIEPKVLTVVPDPESTTSEAISFRASVVEIPPGNPLSFCEGGLYLLQSDTLEPVAWQVQSNSALSPKGNGLELTFQLERLSKQQPKLYTVLELCQGDNRFVYRGDLPRTITLVSYEIEVQWQKREGPDQTLVLRIPNRPAEQARILETQVLKGTDVIPGLRTGSTVAFRPQEDFYQAEIPFNCSSGKIELPKLSLTARDRQGQYLFKSNSEETLCPQLEPPPLGVWLLGGALFIALAVCAFVYRHRLRGWVRREKTSEYTSPQNPPPPQTPTGRGIGVFPDSFPVTWKSGLEEILKSQLVSLYNTLQEVRDLLIQVRRYQGSSPGGTGDPIYAYGTSEVGGQRETSSPYKPLQAQPGDTLKDLVSRWWSEGAERDRLEDLILRNSSIKPYRSSNVQDSLRSTTNRTFLFQPAEGQAEWLGKTQQGELFLVPGDPKLFQTGDSLKFLGVLFEGLGSNLSNVKFRRVVKACRLRKEPGFTDRYRLAERGFLEFEGGPAAETFTSPSLAPARALQPTPPVQPILPKKELTEVVRQAVEGALPGGLADQIQDLSRQVRTLVQSGARQASEPQRPDTNIAAALGAVHQDLSAISQRINAIEGMTRVVDSLRESLARIEGELRNVRAQQPLPPPVIAPVQAPTAEAGVRDLRSEAWVEEIREEMKDVIPGAISPSYPQSITVPDQLETPERLWARLRAWWPPVLNGRIPDDYYTVDPSGAYRWSLDNARHTLSKASADRGWQVEVVHVKVPDNSPAGERILQIHEPNSIEEQRVVCVCAPTSPFVGSLLFQFALRVRGDQGQDIAVLPAPGLRLTGSTEGYARLAGGKLPESATSLAEILRPAILSQAGSGDLYTVVLPMQAKFR